MDIKIPYIATALSEPEKVLHMTLTQWDQLVRQARRAGVLARLGYILESKQILTETPKQVQQHIQSAQIYAHHISQSLDWEIMCLQKALDSIGVPLVLLKGAAYAEANDQARLGRVFTDIDILVPEKDLAAVERALNIEGWKAGYVNKYDQQYYRRWMHELPPMRHVQRHTSIDVHHNILPKTCKHCPEAKKLLDNVVQISGTRISVLSPEIRVIHSATHLFHDGELEHGFRDLSDLDLLLKEFSGQADFWIKLMNFTEDLNQNESLYYAIRYVQKFFKTMVPDWVLSQTRQFGGCSLKQKWMDFLFLHALMPDHPSCDDYWTALARWILYVRSHWLRMPLYLLLPHLLRKSVMRLTGKTQH